MSDAIAVRNDLTITGLGDVLSKSGYFQDARDASKAIVKVLAGRELGIGPVASMMEINIIKGKVALSSNLLAGQIKRSGKYDYEIVESSDARCVLRFIEIRGGKRVTLGEAKFDDADAKRAGLAGKDNWKNYPSDMKFARAMSRGTRRFCPDLTSGPAYTPEELGANVDGETGEVINVESAEATDPPPIAEPQSTETATATDADPAAGMGDSDTHITGIPEEVQVKTGTKNNKKWTRYGVKVAGRWFNTFSGSFGLDAEKAQKAGVEVAIEYTTNDKGYHDIDELTVSAEIVDAVVEDGPPEY